MGIGILSPYLVAVSRRRISVAVSRRHFKVCPLKINLQKVPRTFVFDRDGTLIAVAIDQHTGKQFLRMLSKTDLRNPARWRTRDEAFVSPDTYT
jgi:hypothetical protein